jgi:cytochrome c peroxidase
MGEGVKAHRIGFAILLLASASPAWADDLSAGATAGSVSQLQKLGKAFPQAPSQQPQNFPVLPQYQEDADEDGFMGTYQPNGPTVVASSPFFKSLGTNGRTCFTCHQPQNGWALSAESAGERFEDDPADPLFRLIDGAVCPTADVSTPAAMRKAYSLVIDKGLIRIPLPMQPEMQFQITKVQDPYGCNTDPRTGLVGTKGGFLSFYRRPLPSANLNVLTSIMWDGREPNLLHQSIDATLGHAEGTSEPSLSTQKQIVAFEGCTTALTPNGECSGIPVEEGIITTQAKDNIAGVLMDAGATGGPVALAPAVAGFKMCVNDPFGCGAEPFNPAIFSIYTAWANLTGTDAQSDKRRSIARGQQVFNSVQFNISGVAGLNDELGKNNIRGTCGTCHDTPHVGNNSSGRFMNLGVTAPNPPHLDDASLLPVFTVSCTNGTTVQVTDLGRAMVTGECKDIGKTKVPVLRALPGRSPYFHNGAAREIEDLVEFYNDRFKIGLSDQQIADLAAFLESL